LGKTKKERQKFIDEVSADIGAALDAGGMTAYEVTGRPKHLWSIFRKMQSKGVPFEEIHDLIAFRVFVDTVGQCYETLGHIHALWRPIPGRFKDYIAMPKPNGYSSLHTTVIGPHAERIEIQIRTRDMHDVAESGIAAHWAYKETGNSNQVKGAEVFTWLRQLMDWQRDLKDPNEFLDSVKVDLFAEEVYVLTPNGDVIELPRGATPVDFAFAIHSEVGLKCSGAKINGRMVPLKTELKNGDTVEILTDKNQKPNKDWLDFVRTSRARTKIRAVLRNIERERSKEIGLQLLEKEFRRFGTNIQKHLKSGDVEKAFKDSKHKTAEEILIAVGYGKLGPQMVAERVLPDDVFKKPREPQKQSRLGQLIDRVARRSSSGVKIEGIEDMLVHYARCCSPVKGDPIIGYVTRGRGLTIHRRDCQKIMELDPQRRIDCAWDASMTFSRPIAIRVVSDDREGMLADLSAAFTKQNVSISEANCRALGDGHAVNTFKCGVMDLEQLKRVVRSLENVKGVHSVERARGAE
jgi:GTP pyrophosphokinase